MNTRKHKCTSKDSPRQPKQSYRRKSIDERDRISSLSDDLLLHVLSFLDMQNAVCTSILSKRWRCLWTSIPNLSFCKPEVVNNINFMSFLERSLALHVRPNIHKFHLCFPHRQSYGFHVDDWLRFAVAKDVRELTLHLCGDKCHPRGIELYRLPAWLFKNDKLVSLRLSLCVVEVPNHACFSSLRVLSLTQIKLSNELIKKLLAVCPLLEDLSIVVSFGCNTMESVPKYLHPAKVLKLCYDFVLMSIPWLPSLRSYISETKCLSLIATLHYSELPRIANLLRISSELETLSLTLHECYIPYHLDAERERRPDEIEYLESLTFGIPCLVHHLKTIIITMQGVPKRWYLKYPDKKENLIRILLKHAKMLQRMIIHIPERPYSVKLKEEEWLKFKRQVWQKLRAIPRASSCALVLYMCGEHVTDQSLINIHAVSHDPHLRP